MAGERLPERLLPHSQPWFRWTGKCFESATSHMPTLGAIKKMTMKKLLILSWIMLQALPILLAQSPSDSSKVELEGLSRSEIRKIFLSMEETSESYNLAFSSRKANRQSIRSFIFGGLFFAGGIYGLIEASNRPKGLGPLSERFAINLLAVTSFGLGIPLIVRGVNKNKESRNYLNEALN